MSRVTTSHGAVPAEETVAPWHPLLQEQDPGFVFINAHWQGVAQGWRIPLLSGASHGSNASALLFQPPWQPGAPVHEEQAPGVAS